MKEAKISVLALALLAMGACTGDDALVTDGGSSAFLGGDGYVSFNINLPTQTGTRAANDVFDAGVPCEYKVNDATLLLFKGTSESEATFYAAYNLNNTFETVGDTDDNITSSATVTQKITTDGIEDGENLYALVVLNKSGMLTIAGSGKTATGYFGNTALSSTTKFTALQEEEYNADLSEIARATDDNDGNFFMTNAPVFSKPGGNQDPSGGEVSTLAVINTDDIHSTAEAAEGSPAANVYVERGVAKITVSGTNVTSDLDGYDVTINGFVVDQTNTKMYPVRNTIDADWWGYKNSQVGEDDEPYRFVGEASVGRAVPGGSDYVYRTYWGKDPNYDAEIADGELTSIVGETPTTLVSADGESSVYCLENTFNVENMKKNATTRIIVSATITKSEAEEGDDNSFYTLDGNSTILDYDAVVSHIQEQLEGIELVHNALAQYSAGETAFFANVLKITLDTTEGTSVDNAEIKLTLGGSTADFSDGGDAYTALNTGLDDVISAINDDVSVSYYAGGVCYYPILIEHFGNDLTPWATENITGISSYPTDGSGYGSTAEEAWLGRYGVLRNNWYLINVTKLQNVGTATVPEVTTDWDDPMYKYIAVEINVLAWAKRIQDVTL